MLITHLPAPAPQERVMTGTQTACGERAQYVQKSTYDYMLPSLEASRHVHHMVVEGAQSVNCADCDDMLHETLASLSEHID